MVWGMPAARVVVWVVGWRRRSCGGGGDVDVGKDGGDGVDGERHKGFVEELVIVAGLAGCLEDCLLHG